MTALQRCQFGEVALEGKGVADVGRVQLLGIAVARIDGGGDEAGRVGVADQLDRSDPRRLPFRPPRLQVERVKRSEHGVIVDPVTLPPEASVGEAMKIMDERNIGGVPITQNGKVVDSQGYVFDPDDE